MPDSSPSRLSILTVCEGNICRSPLAEQLLRTYLDPERFLVASAGLRAAEGIPMDPLSAERSVRFGGDPGDKTGTQLHASHVSEAHLILTMTRDQRNELVQEYPRAALRTFSMGEFVSLLRLTSEGDPTPLARIRRATQARGGAAWRPSDDVADPINAPASVHDQVAQQIADYAREIASHFAQM